MNSVAAAVAPRAFRLASPAFEDNEVLATRYAGRNPANPNCVGENVSPPLQWSDAPAGTRSLAIVMHDPEGRNGLGVTHWVAYGIDAAVTALPEGAGDGQFPGITGGSNILGLGTYYGPCPPKTHGLHHYFFLIVATDLEPGTLAPGLTLPELIRSLETHALGAAGLIGRFGHPGYAQES